MSGLEVIPVLDLMGGEVVRARAGDRASYRPIRTPLAASSRPADVLAGLLALHPFRTVYLADLDAIQGQGDQRRLTRELRHRHSGLDLWVDAGFRMTCDARGFLEAGLGHLVLGTESQRDTVLLERLGQNQRLVLSLDYRGDQPLGPPEIHGTPSLWPRRVIVMTLAAVGGGLGPDLDRLRTVLELAGDRQVFAAGGVRDRADLEALADLGCAGVLVASALHDGKLGPADIQALAP